MSRVRDNLISTSGFNINTNIGKFAVAEDNDIKSGDFVKYVSREVKIVEKEVNKEYVNDNGETVQYTEIVDSGVIIPPDTYYLFESKLLTNVVSEKLDDDKVILLYTNDENITYLRIGNIDVSTGVISYKDPVRFINNDITDISIIKTTVNRVFISYKIDNVYKGAVVNINNDDSINYSTDFVIVENVESYSVELLEYNKIMIAYTSDNKIYLRAYNVLSDTIILISSRIYNYIVDSSFVNLRAVNNNRLILSYVDINNFNYLSSVLVTFSVVNINFGNPTVSNNIVNPINLNSTKVSEDSIYIVYSDNNDNSHQAIISLLNDNSIKFSDVMNFATKSKYPICNLIAPNKVSLMYKDIDNNKLYTRIHDLNVGLLSNKYIFNSSSIDDVCPVSVNLLDGGYLYTMFGEIINGITVGNSCLLTIAFNGLYTEVSNQFYDFILDDIVKPIEVNKYKLQFNSMTKYIEEEKYHSIVPSKEYINITEGRGHHLNSILLSNNRVLHIYADSYDFEKGKVILTKTDKDTDISNVIDDSNVIFDDIEITGIHAISLTDSKVLIMYTTLENDDIVGNCRCISIADDNTITIGDKYIFTDDSNDITGSFLLTCINPNKAIMTYNTTIEEECIVNRIINISDDNTISFGSTDDRFGSYASYLDSVLLSPNKVLLIYNDSSMIGSQLSILNVGESAVSVAEPLRFTTRTTTYKNILKLSSNKVLVSYIDAVDNSILKSFIVKISGTNIIMYQDAQIISDINASYVKTVKVCNNCVLFVYKNGSDHLEARLAIIRGLTLELHTPLIINYSEGNDLCNTDINLIKMTDENILVSLNENIEGIDLVTLCQLSINYDISISTDIDGVAKTSGIGGDNIYVYIPDIN